MLTYQKRICLRAWHGRACAPYSLISLQARAHGLMGKSGLTLRPPPPAKPRHDRVRWTSLCCSRGSRSWTVASGSTPLQTERRRLKCPNPNWLTARGLHFAQDRARAQPFCMHARTTLGTAACRLVCLIRPQHDLTVSSEPACLCTPAPTRACDLTVPLVLTLTLDPTLVCSALPCTRHPLLSSDVPLHAHAHTLAHALGLGW